jgi:hypothetical protein
VSYDPEILKKVVAELAQLILKANGGKKLKPLTLEEFYAGRSGHSKQRFGKAISQVLNRGFDPMRDSKIKAFQKVETYESKEEQEFADEVKDPRMIMGRDPVFGLAYGRFTAALEKVIKNVPGFDKGKDFFEMGKFMEEHPQEFWTYYMDDAKKFESSQREKCLRDSELSLYELIFDTTELDVLRACFEIKMFKHGFTRLGLEFLFYALRCSGEVDTWFGNTILNWIAHRYFEVVNNLPPLNFSVTGDDGNGATPKGLPPLTNTFPLFGFDCKLDFYDDPNDVEFCSAKYLEYYPGKWMLCPDPRKIMRNIGILKNTDFSECIGHFYYSLGYMYKIMFGDFPFFSQLADFLMSITKNDKVKHINLDLLRHVNPAQIEMLKTGPTTVEFSENLVIVGLRMAYGLQPSELEKVYEYFSQTEVFVTGRDKRFNRKGVRSPEFSSQTLSNVQALMDKILLESRSRVLSYIQKKRDLAREQYVH